MATRDNQLPGRWLTDGHLAQARTHSGRLTPQLQFPFFWQHYVDGAEDIAELQDRDHDRGPGQEHVKDMPRVRCSRSPLAHMSGRFRLHGLLLGCKMICVSRGTTRLRCRAGWLRKGFCSFVGLEPPIECNWCIETQYMGLQAPG